jgi:hypothetical protein
MMVCSLPATQEKTVVREEAGVLEDQEAAAVLAGRVAQEATEEPRSRSWKKCGFAFGKSVNVMESPRMAQMSRTTTGFLAAATLLAGVLTYLGLASRHRSHPAESTVPASTAAAPDLGVVKDTRPPPPTPSVRVPPPRLTLEGSSTSRPAPRTIARQDAAQSASSFLFTEKFERQRKNGMNERDKDEPVIIDVVSRELGLSEPDRERMQAIGETFRRGAAQLYESSPPTSRDLKDTGRKLHQLRGERARAEAGVLGSRYDEYQRIFSKRVSDLEYYRQGKKPPQSKPGAEVLILH